MDENLDRMNQPLLSVVSAVYETEEFFRRCVDSILASDYPNMEVILVDDGSPDNCPQLCDEYAGKDQRIRVIHKANGGCHTAQNAGIAAARGKYIAFCDNDDWVPTNAYRLLMKKAIETDADVVQGTVRRTRSDSGETRLWKRKETDTLKTKIIGFQGAVFRADMLKQCGIEFIPYRIGDDTGFMIQVLHYAEKIEFIDDITYEYIIRPSNAKAASAMQMTNFAHYYDDFRWRSWALNFIRNSEKLMQMSKGHMGEFCMVIDERWLHLSREERELCFQELKKMVSDIDWEHDVQKSVGYLQIDYEKLLHMTEEQYTNYLKREFRIKRPIRKLLKKG